MNALRPEREPRRLRERLAALRHRGFVGRDPELALFRAALHDPDPPFAVLHVHGPGGVGKTSLLHEYLRLAEEADVAAVMLDGRNVDPSPAGVLQALDQALGVQDGASAIGALAALPRAVLLIDTYETLAPLDVWFREQLLPQLSAHTIVVLAGRHPPAAGWRTEGAWGELLRVIPLRNLLPEESRMLLRGRGVPDDQHASVLEFTHGHPLALSLVAEVLAHGRGDTGFVPEHAHQVVRVLLEKFVQEVPSPSHRRALRLCALARVTTEPLLAAVLGSADAPDLFDWLADLSFIERGPHGLFPHDLARGVLEADFRWRDPSGHQDLFARLREHLVGRLEHARGSELQRAFVDLTFPVRDLPFFKPYYDWRQSADSYAEPATGGDLPGILAMVLRHEGPESARIVEYWFQRQPGGFTAIRGAGRKLIGFLVLLDLNEVTPADLAFDPGARVAWEYAQRNSPARPGEELLLQRAWMDHEAYQAASATFLVVGSAMSAVYLSRPRLAWTFHPGADPDYWVPLMGLLNFQRCEPTDFEVGGRRYGNWVHDWRVEPAPMWIKGMVERVSAAVTGGTEPPSPAPPPLLVLSEPAFADAVRQALRDYAQPAALAKNPLLRSRVLADGAGAEPTPAILQGLIREAAETLRGTPGSEKFYRAIERTYLLPARSQEKAAEQLGLPFNTYRYHLAKGIGRITDWLWARELGGPGGYGASPG